MSESKLYYIYLDTKIVGAVEQLIGYFRGKVFNKDDCINVICKYYKEIEVPFQGIFNSHGIPYKFIKKQSDLSLEKNKVVFYLFNAQSNCRLVANRDLIHIFVTHGESHKLASVKPIIRIYDYVITSGKVGIERYLKSGIFSPYDVEIGKIITLGNTFLGNNNFIHNENCDAIVYAPTWEGGVPEENYCSINLKNTLRIITFCKNNKINKLYLRPHPNIGHRDIEYKKSLKSSVAKFQKEGLIVVINKVSTEKKWHGFFHTFKIKTEEKNEIEVKYAITDISAMEMQFISKKVPCVVLMNHAFTSKLLIPRALKEHYSRVFLSDEMKIEFNTKSEEVRDSLFNYLFTYPANDIENMSLRERITWLCSYTQEHKKEYRQRLEYKY